MQMKSHESALDRQSKEKMKGAELEVGALEKGIQIDIGDPGIGGGI